MALKKVISDDTRVIDLTVGELVALLAARLPAEPPPGAAPADCPEALLDTWQTARMLGIHPRRELGPEPPAGTAEHRQWRQQEQALRNEVARRLQSWMERHPQVAQLAIRMKGERRRYFRRQDIAAYLDRAIATPARRRFC
jgi:hypothetical protein